MKFRVAAILFAACGATALLASSASAGPIQDRQQMMKNVQAATKDGVALSRGTVPFDAAKAKTVLNVYIDAAAKLPAMFPKGSGPESGTKTAADPKIWTDTAGFQAASVKFGADAKAGLAATDTASFNKAFTEIFKDCNSCHSAYRVKQQ
jgi:cytochrome c556